MTIDLSQFHQVFFEESVEGLDAMEVALMELDSNAINAEIINTIFRSAHSIKGGSATFGFKVISDFTHDLETLLDQIRDGRRGISKDDINLFLQAVDCMREMLELLRKGEDKTTETASSLQARFSAMLSGSVPSEGEAVATAANKQNSLRSCRIHFAPGKEILQTGNDVLRMFRELAELGNISSVECQQNLPAFADMTPELCYLSWDICIESEKSREELLAVFEWVADESRIELSEESISEESINEESISAANKNESVGLKQEKQPAAQSGTQAKANLASESSSIRVGIDKIDNLINLVGELVITQSMLGQLGTDFNVRHLPRLLEGLGQLEQNTRELQESVMRIRMLPISFAFSRFPRLVRDLGQKLGKSVNLVLLGEQTELDKTVMEKIGDPLVHLVRNAVDHGIETPEERVKLGKPATGTVTLNAWHQSGNVVIEIRDDGKGLHCEALLAKAIEKKVISQEEANTLSEEKIFDLIFHPGFSTAKVVSDVSGRGVGMDVVKKNIQALNGSVEIKSQKHQGSTITIRLPLTLAILDGQLVRVGGNIYVFPLVSIVESMQYREEFINDIAGGCNVFRLRDDYVPVVELHKVFSVQADVHDMDTALMVVVESDGEKIGIVVDELLAQQQVVIKSLEQNYHRVNGVSGATILGDGTVALILDIPGIVKLAGDKFQQTQTLLSSRAGHEGEQRLVG